MTNYQVQREARDTDSHPHSSVASSAEGSLVPTAGPQPSETRAAGNAENAIVAKEFRFSVVMYGGVSLAIYMNGVTQELLHMVRSTARNQESTQFRFDLPAGSTAASTNPAGWLRSTETVYRKVARALNDSDKDDVRFIVDVISGTSAGGINGIFLAKALTDDSLTFDVLQSLWIKEGALENLLNDRMTTKGAQLPAPDPPKSLLCSDRMYIKLLDALRQMKGDGDSGPPLCDEIDLFVTTTDITGRVVPLRLADMLVWERKYKEDFHFRFNKEQSNNDFVEVNNPFIAFVARCTSSFPFAFEPMQLSKLQELQTTPAWPTGLEVTPENLNQWKEKFFDNTEQVATGDNLTRAFGDGGYLNNKPFSYVVDMLGRHSSSLPTERKLIYVEPSPDHPESEAAGDNQAAADKTNAPNALTNSYDALIKLPGAQPIHDDLQRVIERNRLVRKVTELSALVTARIYDAAEEKRDNGVEGPPNLLESGFRFTRLRANSVGDFSYLVLRVYAGTDDLAKVLAEWLHLPSTSSYYYGIRCLVRAWREMTYEELGGTRLSGNRLIEQYHEFLDAFDLDYEKRRYRFVRQQINAFYCFDQPAIDRLKSGFKINVTDEEKKAFGDDFQKALIELKKPFDEASKIVNKGLRQIRPSEPQGAANPGQLATGTEQQPPQTAVATLQEAFRNLKAATDKFKEKDHAAKIDDAVRRLESIGRARKEVAGEAPDSDKTGRSVAAYVLGVGKQEKGRMYASIQADQDEGYFDRAKKVLRGDPQIDQAVNEVAAAMARVIRRTVQQSRRLTVKDLTKIQSRLPDTAGARAAVTIVNFFCSHFELFDAAIFPLLYDTDVGTPEPIGIIRVSPEDATALFDEAEYPGSQKLAGASLAHFGAFLDRSFRTNDILWGRLDGAERIIRALLGTQTHKPTADTLILETQSIIVDDYLRERQAELGGLIFEVAKALDQSPAPRFWTKVRNRLRAPFGRQRSRKKIGKDAFGGINDDKVVAVQQAVSETLGSLPNQAIKQAVQGFLTRDRILEYLKQPPPVRDPDHRSTLESITRALRIVGGMLEGLGNETKAAGGFLIRVASALWWLVEAAVPKGLTGHFFRKFFAMLFWFEIVMVVGGTFFSHEAQTLGLKLLAVTTLLWLLKDAFQRFMLYGKKGLRVTMAFVVLAILIGSGTWAGLYLREHKCLCLWDHKCLCRVLH